MFNVILFFEIFRFRLDSYLNCCQIISFPILTRREKKREEETEKKQKNIVELSQITY